MIQHEVHDDYDISFTAFLNQCFIVFHCSKLRINGIVVIHIIFMIGTGRMHGCQPQCRKAHVLDVIQL